MTSTCAGWVSGDAGISENECTDQAVKKALNCDVELCLTSHSDLKPLIDAHIKSKWHHKWDENINKLHDVEPSVGNPPQIHMGGGSWQDEVVLSHCLISHPWLTHAFLL